MIARSIVVMLLALLLLTSGPSGVPAAVPMPNPRLTPGHVFVGATAATVCQAGYASSVRHVSTRERLLVYRRYGILHHRRGQYEIDHLISLELGGDNSVLNLWPEPYHNPYGAHTKDRLENYLHRQVCAGTISLDAAQHAIATNWYAAWLAAGKP